MSMDVQDKLNGKTESSLGQRGGWLSRSGSESLPHLGQV